MEKTYLKKSETFSFAASAFGRSMIYTLMSTFALIFYTDMGIKPAHAGTIIFIARICDALNDPIMGMIVDRTHTKDGKMRPFLKWAPLPIAISTALLFFAPAFENYSLKVAYAAFSYILWGICFTVQDIPFWSLSSAVTPNEKERTRFVSTARVGSTIGGILPTVIVPVLIGSSLGLRNGYLVSGCIFGVVGASISLLAYFGTKERVEGKADAYSFKELFGAVAKNKLLLLIVAASLLGSTMVMAQSASVYIANYLITDSGVIPKGILLTVLTVAIGVGMLPAMVILPFLRKHFSLKQIYIGSALLGAAVTLALWFIGYSNIYVFMICLVFYGIPLGVFNVITYNLVADAVDYNEYKTGRRTEGVCFAAQTLISQANAGISTFIVSLMLEKIAYKSPLEAQNNPEGIKELLQTLGLNDFVANTGLEVKQMLEAYGLDKLDIQSVTQSASTVTVHFMQSEVTTNGLFAMVTLIPCIGFVLCAIPMFFNTYTGKKKDAILKELEERRAKAEEETAYITEE